MKKFTRILPLAVAAAVLAACATTKDVDQKVAAAEAQTNQKIESVASQVEELQDRQSIAESRMAQLSQSAQEALKRAREAGVLAKGEVSFEQSFSEDRIKFAVGSAELDVTAKAALDEFASRLKQVAAAYYVEIQGHTDDTGTEFGNEMLGQRRADAVRRYLSRQHQIPLVRMSTISYGDTLPVQSNQTATGKAANRRVVIVVLE